MALNFVLVYLVEELFATKRVTRYLDSVKIFLNKAKPEVCTFYPSYLPIAEIWYVSNSKSVDAMN